MFTIPDKLKNNLTDESSLHIYAKVGEEVELSIMSEIGEGVGIGATEVRSFLAENADKPVRVLLNSPGGLVFDGISIYNSLKSHSGKVTGEVLGIAFSAASIIAMATDELLMHEGTQLGVHRAWGATVGNANDLRATANILDQIDEDLVGIYRAKTGASEAKVNNWLDGEKGGDGTWFRAEEAVKQGFATAVIPHRENLAAKKRGFDPKLEALLATMRADLVK